MNIVLVPNWLETILLANSQKLSAALDPKILSSTLSREDFAFYIYLNRHVDRWLFPEISKTFKTGDGVLNITSELAKDLEGLYLGYVVEKKANPEKKLGELFSPLTNSIENSTIEDITYEVQFLSNDTLGIIPKLAGGLSPIGMVESLLSNLNGVISYNDLAKKPLFKYFIAQL